MIPNTPSDGRTIIAIESVARTAVGVVAPFTALQNVIASANQKHIIAEPAVRILIARKTENRIGIPLPAQKIIGRATTGAVIDATGPNGPIAHVFVQRIIVNLGDAPDIINHIIAGLGADISVGALYCATGAKKDRVITRPAVDALLSGEGRKRTVVISLKNIDCHTAPRRPLIAAPPCRNEECASKTFKA